jgi:hypothetical protein
VIFACIVFRGVCVACVHTSCVCCVCVLCVCFCFCMCVFFFFTSARVDADYTPSLRVRANSCVALVITTIRVLVLGAFLVPRE